MTVKLSLNQKKALVLFMGGMNVKECAKELRVSQVTAHKYLVAAIKVVYADRDKRNDLFDYAYGEFCITLKTKRKRELWRRVLRRITSREGTLLYEPGSDYFGA